jgi:CheY-like chemotaxis protein
MAIDPNPVLALVRDLIFATKISTAAKGVGVAVKMIRDPAMLGQEPGRLLLVDLNLPGAIEAAAQWRAGTAAGPVIGFVSHVDADTAARARSAGIEQVMARSRFVQVLPDLLAPP